MNKSVERLLILSGSTKIQFPTILNHRIYADKHGYRYRFDATPYRGINNLYFHKLAIIADALQDCEWLFWLDDDAAFSQISVPFDQLVPQLNQPEQPVAVFCKSPVNMGRWTYLSSGNFFLRNCQESRELLQRCLATDLEIVRQWWDEETYGMFTNGDQDAIVYQIAHDESISQKTHIMNYELFNTRPYHFRQPDDHFLVHFTYHPDRSKRDQMRIFAEAHGLSEFLVQDNLLDPYRKYLPELRALIGEG